MFHFMILLVTPVLVSVAVGYATGGRLANLPSLRLRALWLLWLATAVQAAQDDLPWRRWLVQDDPGIPLPCSRSWSSSSCGGVAVTIVGWPRWL